MTQALGFNPQNDFIKKRKMMQPRTQGSIYAPVALPLRKNPGPGWSRASQNMGSSII